MTTVPDNGRNMNFCVKILLANVQSLKENKGEIIQEIKTENYCVLMLSETWTKENESRQYNIQGFYQIIKSRPDGYGGVAIYLLIVNLNVNVKFLSS